MIRLPTDKDKKRRLFESLSNLEHHEGFKVVIGWLEEEHSRMSKDNNTILDNSMLRWSQGQCQSMDFIVSNAKEARSILDKLRKQPQPKGRT